MPGKADPNLERRSLGDKFSIDELPFDQYQRYKIVQEIADLIRTKKRLKILDVGGYPGVITHFLPDDDISLLDTVKAELPNYTRGNALSLPFDRNSFNLVTSIDVLEHIASEDREKAVKELLRVSKDLVIIGAPVNVEKIRLAEEILGSFTFEVLKEKNKFLLEHLKNALPGLGKLEALLGKNRLDYVIIPNGYLRNWLAMNLANAYIVSLPNSSNLYRKVNKFYNLNFYQYDNRDPSYRQIIIVSKKGKNLSSLKKRLIAKTTRLDEIYLLQLLQLFLRGTNIREEIQSIFQEKEGHIKALRKHTRNLENLIQQKDNHIRNLEKEIAEKTRHTLNLEDLIREKGKHIRNLEAMFEEKEKHIKNLAGEVAGKSKRVKNLETEIEKTDKHIKTLEININQKGKQITDLKLLRQVLEEEVDNQTLQLEEFRDSKVYKLFYRKRG